jgi:hypothetical protein
MPALASRDWLGRIYRQNALNKTGLSLGWLITGYETGK